MSKRDNVALSAVTVLKNLGPFGVHNLGRELRRTDWPKSPKRRPTPISRLAPPGGWPNLGGARRYSKGSGRPD
jgi:hypothetical protein